MSAFPEAMVLAALCRQSFAAFVREFWDTVPGSRPCRWNWHMDVLCDELQKVAERVFKGLPKEYDLVINVPPGTSKSTIVSILFPAWTWTRMPEARHVCASHTDTLVLDLGSKCRSVVKSEKYHACFPTLRMSADQDSKEHFRLESGGERMTCTVAGKSPTGRHADFIIPDDPIDPKRARSVADKVTAAHFVREVIPTRMVEKGVTPIIMVMQRLGVGDPTDVMEEIADAPGACPLRRVCLPGVLETDKDHANVSPPELLPNYTKQPDGTYLLDEHRLGKVALGQLYAALQEAGFAAQVKQAPHDVGSGMFRPEYFGRRRPTAPWQAKRVLYVDRASSTKDTACNTAITLMGKTPPGPDHAKGEYFVEYCRVGKWDPVQRNQEIRNAAQEARDRYGPYHEPELWIEMEGGSTNADAWLMLCRALEGFNPRQHNPAPEGSKERRAEGWSCQLAAGNVFLVDDGSWDIKSYVREHVAFPGSELKDRVDSSAGAFNRLAGPVARERTIHVIRGQKKNNELRIAVLGAGDLEFFGTDDSRRCLMVEFSDPPAPGEPRPQEPPHHKLGRLDGFLKLYFLDGGPEDWQHAWEQPVAPWGTPARDLIMRPEDARRFWGFLNRPRVERPDVWVLYDPAGGRALSAALAACKALGVEQGKTVWVPGDQATSALTPPSRHVFDLIRHARASVL